MLIESEIKDDKVYLNICSGAVKTGAELIELLGYMHKDQLKDDEIPTFAVQLDDWVDKDDVGRGRKFDTGKPQWSLIPASELEDVAKVFTMGAEKYGRENWKKVEDGMFRYFDAMQRHISEYKLYMETGDESHLFDSESGLHHLSHAVTNALFLMWLDNNDGHVWLQENLDDEYDISM